MKGKSDMARKSPKWWHRGFTYCLDH